MVHCGVVWRRERERDRLIELLNYYDVWIPMNVNWLVSTWLSERATYIHIASTCRLYQLEIHKVDSITLFRVGVQNVKSFCRFSPLQPYSPNAIGGFAFDLCMCVVFLCLYTCRCFLRCWEINQWGDNDNA